jgi:succinoglycan biosynthesis transport protein ExoP
MMSLLSAEQLGPVLRARWRRILLTWLAVVGVVVVVSLSLPRRYEATASVVVEMSGTDPIGGQAVFKPAGAVSAFIATQADIIRSEEVALGALRKLGLQDQQAWRDKWQQATSGQGDFESWLAGQLQRRLDVRPSRDSNLLTVGFSSAEPEFSAAVANAVVQSFIDTTVQMQTGPARRFNSFFAERAKPLREQLDQARSRLSAYEKEHGIAVGEEPDLESARLAELNSQLVNLQDAAAEASNARKQALASPGDMREVRNDPQVAVLTGELVRQEGHLADLRSEFGERHPAVMQARQSIAAAKQRLEGARRRSAESLGASSKVLEARLAEVRAAITRQQALVLKRKSERDAAAGLLRDVENAQKAYSAVLSRASQTALESANTTQTTVSVLKSATPPLWSPSTLIRNLIVAVLLGLLLGIARALLAERRDRRLRTVEDVVRGLQQPLLLALPDGARGRDRRSEQTRRRLVAPYPRLAAPRQGAQS